MKLVPLRLGYWLSPLATYVWLWAEGWRQRLRKSGDIVEKSRWEWRVDDVVGRGRGGRGGRDDKAIPHIVARLPTALKGGAAEGGGAEGQARRKSVRFE